MSLIKRDRSRAFYLFQIELKSEKNGNNGLESVRRQQNVWNVVSIVVLEALCAGKTVFVRKKIIVFKFESIDGFMWNSFTFVHHLVSYVLYVN